MSKVGWYTRALASFNPAAARKRLASRMQFENMSRGYASAVAQKGTSFGRAKATSANAEIGVDIGKLRDLARRLVRDTPEAASAVHKTAGYIIGTGIECRANPSALLTPETRRQIEAVCNAEYARFAANSDVATGGDWFGQQLLAARSFRESGECILLWRARDNEPDSIVDVLDGDQLDHLLTTKLGETKEGMPSGNRIVQGVEFDQQGVRVAFWMFPQHPGDPGSGTQKAARVEAKFVDHIYQPLRPGQVRGVTPFASVALRLARLGDLSEAGVKTALVQALVGMQITTEDGDAGGVLGPETDGEVQLSPGFVWRGKPGEEIKPFTPGGLGAPLMQQIERELYSVAAGLGLPYNEMTGDQSKSNYTSLRAAKISFATSLENWQWLVFIPRMIMPAWRRSCERAALKLPEGTSPELMEAVRTCPGAATPPFMPLIDPLKDAMGEQLEIRSGLKTMYSALGARGISPTQQADDFKAWNDLMDARGLTLDSDPRRTSGSGVTQARPEASDFPTSDPLVPEI